MTIDALFNWESFWAEVATLVGVIVVEAPWDIRGATLAPYASLSQTILF
jgi:hypothetical protein